MEAKLATRSDSFLLFLVGIWVWMVSSALPDLNPTPSFRTLPCLDLSASIRLKLSPISLLYFYRNGHYGPPW